MIVPVEAPSGLAGALGEALGYTPAAEPVPDRCEVCRRRGVMGAELGRDHLGRATCLRCWLYAKPGPVLGDPGPEAEPRELVTDTPRARLVDRLEGLGCPVHYVSPDRIASTCPVCPMLPGPFSGKPIIPITLVVDFGPKDFKLMCSGGCSEERVWAVLMEGTA